MKFIRWYRFTRQYGNRRYALRMARELRHTPFQTDSIEDLDRYPITPHELELKYHPGEPHNEAICCFDEWMESLTPEERKAFHEQVDNYCMGVINESYSRRTRNHMDNG